MKEWCVAGEGLGIERVSLNLERSERMVNGKNEADKDSERAKRGSAMSKVIGGRRWTS